MRAKATSRLLQETDRAIVTYEAALEANRKSPRRGYDAIALANMAKVRAERQEYLLAVSLGEAALEIAREHLPEHVAEILANLAEAYADLHLLPQANACLDEADESLSRIESLGRTSPMATRSLLIASLLTATTLTGRTSGCLATSSLQPASSAATPTPTTSLIFFIMSLSSLGLSLCEED